MHLKRKRNNIGNDDTQPLHGCLQVPLLRPTDQGPSGRVSMQHRFLPSTALQIVSYVDQFIRQGPGGRGGGVHLKGQHYEMLIFC